MRGEFLFMSVRSLRRRQVRSWLTLLGIFIGIASVVALISLGQGVEEAIIGEFDQLGGDKLIVQADSQLGSIGEGASANPLTTDDVDFLQSQSDVASVTYYVFGSARVEFRGSVEYLNVVAVPTSEPETFDGYFGLWVYDTIDGRNLQINDRNNAILGYQLANRQLFDGENIGVGDKFSINDVDFRAAGVYESTGSGPDDRTITITDTAYENAIGDIDRVDAIVVVVTDEERLEAISERLSRNLARYRGADEDDPDFSMQTPLELLASFQTILNVVQAVIIGIAAISLFVGGIGIMNTMYTAVLERRKDIGIMKAIGARNSDIFSLFFIESGLLGLVGGIAGIVFGALLAWLVELISTVALGTPFLQAYFSWQLFVGAVLFSFVVGAVAGTLPAWQASREQAADTLRDE